MTVYIVIVGDYGGNEVDDVFASESAAQRRCEELKAKGESVWIEARTVIE